LSRAVASGVPQTSGDLRRPIGGPNQPGVQGRDREVKAMSKILDTVLLLALPASGKSEVRKYLASLSPEKAGNDFHMGPTVQLDDFPYVHMMRRIDDELKKLGKNRIFFHSPERPFINPGDWGTLIHLVNEDYQDMTAKRRETPDSAAQLLMERLEKAALKAGEKARIASLDPAIRETVAKAVEKEASDLLKEKHGNYPDTLEKKTLVIEFARGGPDGSSMPLPAPLGYRHSVGLLSDDILKKAVILYVWVTPEESRRKNTARANPDDPGSILHHGVPMEVMLKDYGCDDMDWLEANARVRGTIPVTSGTGREYNIPIARFDNRVDKTSFIREDIKSWKKADVEAVHNSLKSALDKLAEFSVSKV
ncbi:MAG: hypothetical protein ABIG11_04855, partial [bacterium]